MFNISSSGGYFILLLEMYSQSVFTCLSSQGGGLVMDFSGVILPSDDHLSSANEQQQEISGKEQNEFGLCMPPVPASCPLRGWVPIRKVMGPLQAVLSTQLALSLWILATADCLLPLGTGNNKKFLYY